jgi:hypothetical protein
MLLLLGLGGGQDTRNVAGASSTKIQTKVLVHSS